MRIVFNFHNLSQISEVPGIAQVKKLLLSRHEVNQISFQVLRLVVHIEANTTGEWLQTVSAQTAG